MVKFQRKTTAQFIAEAKVIHKQKYDYSQAEYLGAHVKLKIICPTHNIFWQTPHTHLKGRGCAKCGFESSSKLRIKSLEDFILDAQKIHNFKYKYDKAIYLGNKIKLIIICPEHGQFQQTPNSHLRKSGCPECKKQIMTVYNSNDNVKLNHQIRSKNFWENLNKNEIDKISLKRKSTYFKKTGFVNPSQNPEVINKIHLSKKKNKSYGKSIPEDLLVKILSNITEIKRQEIINNQAIDIFLPKYNLYIQVDGVYYHGLNRSIEEVKQFKTKTDKNIYQTIIRDNVQNIWFKENGYNLIRISDQNIISFYKKNINIMPYWVSNEKLYYIWNEIIQKKI